MNHTIKCGHCTGTHATVADVRFCQMETAYELQMCLDEQRAELAAERYFERGPGLTNAEMYGDMHTYAASL